MSSALIEAIRDTKDYFLQTLDSDYISIDPDTILCEANLWQSDMHSNSELRHCILTNDSIISCKINYDFSENTSSKSANNVISFDWPLFFKIDTLHFSGFILQINNSTCYKFLFTPGINIKEWYENLSQICIQTDIENEYEIKNVIGKGGSSIVRKAIHKNINQKVAIKCFSRSEIFKKRISYVFFKPLKMQRI